MRFKELSSPKKTQNLKVPHSWLLIFLLSSSSVRSAKESSVIWQWYWYTNWLVLSVKLLHLSIHNLSCKQFGCYNVLHLLTKKSQTLYQNKRSGLIGVLRTLKFMSRRSHFIQERRVLSLMPLTKIQFVFSCQHWQKWSTSLSLMYVLFFLFVTLCNFYLFSCSFFEFFSWFFPLLCLDSSLSTKSGTKSESTERWISWTGRNSHLCTRQHGCCSARFIKKINQYRNRFTRKCTNIRRWVSLIDKLFEFS